MMGHGKGEDGAVREMDPFVRQQVDHRLHSAGGGDDGRGGDDCEGERQNFHRSSAGDRRPSVQEKKTEIAARAGSFHEAS